MKKLQYLDILWIIKNDVKLGHTYLTSCCLDLMYSNVGWSVGKKHQVIYMKHLHQMNECNYHLLKEKNIRNFKHTVQL